MTEYGSSTAENLPELGGSTLALILWAKDTSGADDVAVFHGRLERQGDALVLVRPDGSKLDILPEWHSRIKRPDPSVATIVSGADFTLSLSVGPLPETGDNSGFVPLGLVWPA
jgi:hypothetical protein